MRNKCFKIFFQVELSLCNESVNGQFWSNPWIKRKTWSTWPWAWQQLFSWSHSIHSTSLKLWSFWTLKNIKKSDFFMNLTVKHSKPVIWKVGSKYVIVHSTSIPGTRWFGKCWHFHDLKKYKFDVEFDILITYPMTAPEIALPELDRKTAKMYRGGKIYMTDHFKPAKMLPEPRS